MPQYYRRFRIGLGGQAKGCLLFYAVLGLLLAINVVVVMLLSVGNQVGLWNVPLPEGGAGIPQRLRSSTTIVQARALMDLGKVPPDRGNREIAEALKAALKSDGSKVRSDAATALGAWGGPEDVAALVAVVESADPRNPRAAAMKSMGELGGTQAAGSLAQCLKNSRDRTTASAVLLRMGAPAEEAVRAVLADEAADIDGRLEAAVLLRDIGTEQSVPTLHRIAAVGAPRLVEPAKRAIEDIEAR